MNPIVVRGRAVPVLLIGAGIGAVAIAVLLIAGLLVDRWPFAFDRAVVVGLRRWGGPGWLRDAAIDVTALGGGTVLTIVTVAATGMFLVRRMWWRAAAVAAAIVSGGMLVDVAKTLIGRPRPDLVPHLVRVAHMSFPSGHSANSAVVYLTLAALGGEVAASRVVRRYVFMVAVLLVGAIGCSRVYLGVHWPSDVLAGWSFGTLWALGWWTATAGLRVRAR